MARRFLVLAALSALVVPAAAVAQTTPSPAPIVVPTLPPSATSGINPQIINAAQNILRNVLQQQQNVSRNTAHGQVSYFKGYDMQVVVGNNTYRTVHLHRGTEINPRGATIRQGQVVDVQGNGNSDNSLNADRITIVSQ